MVSCRSAANRVADHWVSYGLIQLCLHGRGIGILPTVPPTPAASRLWSSCRSQRSSCTSVRPLPAPWQTLGQSAVALVADPGCTRPIIERLRLRRRYTYQAAVATAGQHRSRQWLLIAVLTSLLCNLTGTSAAAHQSEWLTGPAMPTARAFLAGATAPCPPNVEGLKGTCVYTIGGLNGTSAANALEAYSPATNTWATLPPMPAPRSDLAATTAPCPQHVNGLKGVCVYAIGGVRGERPLISNAVEAYSPATNTWATLPSMPTKRSLTGAATTLCPRHIDGLKGTCVYAVGGRGFFAALNTVEAYSPATNTWATLPSMPTAHAGLHGNAARCPKEADDLRTTMCVYAIGGFNETFPALDTVEAYNPVSNVWATLPSIATARALPAGAAAPCLQRSDEKKPAAPQKTAQAGGDDRWGNAHHRESCIYGGFNRSSQHLMISEVWDGSSSAGSRSGDTAKVEVSGASEISASYRSSVLG
ncbi:kelch repeat-containing protein [Streptomyces sp. NBC_01619]|uniref:Kelch repeat-containing protein n=1 Tax=Streptomyces sp. NBC_01619 TaxID=2975901 RepID=UPI00338F1379